MERFREQSIIEASGLPEYLETLPFYPDPFQAEALGALARGNSVLVAAPTGAGKTVVGEGAVALAAHRGHRAFYTTPIKALSNQKFREFSATFGEEAVGLLTGDTSINPRADIVVMTTEVLRNMIYAGAPLDDLGMVVLDEVHYLADRVRGPVWEEVLIQLPKHTQTVSLSATVSNLKEFGQWIAEVRGACDVVVSYKRPVPLYQHMIVGKRLYDLYANEEAAARGAAGAPAVLNQALLADIASHSPHPGRRQAPRRVNRGKVLRILEKKSLLPMIEFIFSRAACDEAVDSIVGEGITLTTAEERKRIAAEAEKAALSIPIADHGVLGIAHWQRALEQGVAAHHAGMLPIMKETVESLFSQGLVKVVYATETLALGINMPARTVVLESLEKWNGAEHVRLTPGEYTQLTGRAGRRGIDVEGHAVVLHRGVVTAEEVAMLATRHSYPLRSAFFPGYNMVVNLLARASVKQATSILESSFAQFQSDDAVVALASKLKKAEHKLAQAEALLECEAGDVREYFRLREDLAKAQKKLANSSRQGDAEQSSKSLRRIRVGQVIRYRKGRRWFSSAVVVAADPGFAKPLVRVIGEDAKVHILGPADVSRGPEVIGNVRLPRGGARRLRDRQDVAKQVRAVARSTPNSTRPAADPQTLKLAGDVEHLEQELRSHPVHSCPDRDLHAAPGHSWVREERECKRLRAQINKRTSSIAREFDQVRTVLETLGFLDNDKVTDRGQELRRIFGERDLLVALAASEGIFDDLSDQEMAAFATALTFEPRGDKTDVDPRMPTDNLRSAWSSLQSVFDRISRAEKQAGLDRTPSPAGDLVEMSYKWAGGATLSAILPDVELSGGDFVRWMRQAIDLLEQLTKLEGTTVGTKSKGAVKLLRRGVVAWAD